MARCHQFAVLPSPHLPREFSYLCRWASPTGPTLRWTRPGEFPRFRSGRSRKLLPTLAVDPRPGMVLFDRDTDGNLHMVGDHLPPRLFNRFRFRGVPPGRRRRFRRSILGLQVLRRRVFNRFRCSNPRPASTPPPKAMAAAVERAARAAGAAAAALETVP